MDMRIFYTHIEIFPYHIGDCPKLEKMLSTYDRVYHSYNNIGFYWNDNILYLPRQMDISYLCSLLKVIPTVMPVPDKFEKIKPFNMKYPPKNRIQSDAIKFLTCKDQFARYGNETMLGLNLDTGDGKTFSTIQAIQTYRMKSIIIMHKSRLKNQWKEEFLKMTDIDESRIVNITGSNVIQKIMDGKIEGDIYIVNHQTLHSYARVVKDDISYEENDSTRIAELRQLYYKTWDDKYIDEIEEINKKYEDGKSTYDWSRVREFFKKIKVGIKVVDEAHKFFENTLMIDNFSNVKLSFYLTATFTRGDPQTKRVFNHVYKNLCRFGEETLDYEEKRRHIHLMVMLYHSHPTVQDRRSMYTGHGFSAYKFIEYALNEPNHSLEKILYKALDCSERLEGKTLVLSPKVTSVETVAELIRNYTGKEVGTIHSKNKQEQNDRATDCDIICSTIKSIGEGDNISKLRSLITFEPIGSEGLADQMRGRLRQYSETEDTYLFYPVDTAIPDLYRFFKQIKRVMERKCKSIQIFNFNDI